MVHRRADFVLVVRMRSKRTVAARCINGACLGAQHVADGSLQLYPTDAAALRYLDMPAVWDWHSLPGITAPTDTPFLPCDPKQSEAIGYNWPMLMGGASFVGGASDGEYGAAAMEFGPTGLLHNTGFVLSRSHFAFDNAVVVLGTGLQAVGTPLRIATTVANERLSGMVWVDDGRAIGTVTGRTVLAPVRHDHLRHSALRVVAYRLVTFAARSSPVRGCLLRAGQSHFLHGANCAVPKLALAQWYRYFLCKQFAAY
jgi:hypothetical protein